MPAWAGGRLDGRVRAVVLGPEHAAAYKELVGIHPDDPLVWAPNVDVDTFAVGLFLDARLVAAGFCCRQWALLGINAFFFAGDHVMPSLRGRGLSGVLHQGRLQEAARRNIAEVYAAVFRHNAASVAGYRAAGFDEIPRPDWRRGIERHFRRVGARSGQILVFGRST